MPDPTNDITDLLRDIDPNRITYIANTDRRRYHAAIQALVAERDELQNVLSTQIEGRDALVSERDALRERVAELEAQPPADRDLRADLVCSLLPALLAAAWSRQTASTTAAEMAEAHAAMRRIALVEADAMIDAMRKGDSDAK